MSTSIKSSTTSQCPVPDEWPPEVAEAYEPIRKLGTGGFASVLLARRKGDVKDSTTSNGSSKGSSLVAIKVAGSADANKQQVGYALREIEILMELSHPNIMQLIQHWEPPLESHKCAAVMALSYAKGPDVNKLLNYGGKLSLVFARVVMAQLTDALAYLHSRAVIHRDIKPDNVIVTGADMKDDAVYDDDEEAMAAATAEDDSPPESDYWQKLVKKWHVTLVDFGFARALTPDDMQAYTVTRSQSQRGGLDGSNSSSSSRRLNRSASRKLTRMMSAVGNRYYSAPEVQKGIQKNLDLSSHKFSRHGAVDITKTLADHISFYGLTADAFSLGNTISHMYTGIRPDQNVNEAIAAQSSPLAMLCRFFCKGSGSGNPGGANGGQSTTKRTVEYRPYSKIPGEVKRLIRELTKRDPMERTTVRAARLYPCIDDVLEGRDPPPHGQVKYLTLALNEQAAKKKSTEDEEKRGNATEVENI